MPNHRIRASLPTLTLEDARKLRRKATDAEFRLWNRLRSGQLNGAKFRRQHPIPPYVIDFYCHTAGLAVEIDGSQHSEDVDAVRTRFLESRGLRVLRFWNNDVLLRTDAVVEAIWNALAERPLTPTPLPQGEGLSKG